MHYPKVTRRLAAILAADIAGYAQLMGDDEVATVRALKAHHTLVLPLVAEHGGRLIDTAGDGLLVEFASAVGAVECAAAMQTALARCAADVPEPRRMRWRIGINLGELIHDDDGRVYGEGLNVAARLEGLAAPGGVVVSAKVLDEIEGKVGCGSVDIGPQWLKNIARPVRAHALVLDALANAPAGAAPAMPAANGARAEPIRRLSIVVLPFANANGDAAQDYFADGISEDVTAQLSCIKGSYVIG